MLQNNQADSIIFGYLNPPAGHIEIGETINETVLREVAEEMGIAKLEEIEVKGIVNVSGFKELPIMMFVVSAVVPETENVSDKGEGAPVWVKSEDLKKHKILEDVQKIINLCEITPPGKLFQVVSKFENKNLISFKVSPE